MLQKLRSNKEGFTLIELMIVIAIIGILAAIAIPNFIAYRNKAYCSAAESDAQATMAALADYYSIPGNNNVPAMLLLSASHRPTATLSISAATSMPLRLRLRTPITLSRGLPGWRHPLGRQWRVHHYHAVNHNANDISG